MAPTLRFGDATRGDVLEYYGSGGIDFGYLGGIYDDATGLIYLGSGQYYDPVMGRLLTRGAGQSNPYKPGAYDPAGMMVAPFALIGLALGKKKKRGKWDTFIAVLVVCVVVGMSVSACGPKAPAPTPPPNQPPTGTPSPGPGIVDAMQNPDNYDKDWSNGFSKYRPYGVGNASMFDAGKLAHADYLGLIFWRSGDGEKELIIPMGCGSYILTESNDASYNWVGCSARK